MPSPGHHLLEALPACKTPVPVCWGAGPAAGPGTGMGGLVGAVGTHGAFSPPQEPSSTEPHCQGNSQCEIGLISN